MASFRERGSSWQAQVRRSGSPSISRSFKRKADADSWARQIEGEMDRGGLPADHRALRDKTLADLLMLYKEKITPNKRGALQERYRLDAFLASPLAKTPLDRLSSALIARHRDERLEQVQGSTVRRELALLRHVLEVARKEWDLPMPTNPVASVKLPTLPKARARRLEGDELERILEGCKRCRSPLIEPIIRFALETGMRRGEILSVCWDNVSLDRRTLHIPISKNGHARTVGREVVEQIPEAGPLIDRIGTTHGRVIEFSNHVEASTLRIGHTCLSLASQAVLVVPDVGSRTGPVVRDGC